MGGKIPSQKRKLCYISLEKKKKVEGKRNKRRDIQRRQSK